MFRWNIKYQFKTKVFVCITVAILIFQVWNGIPLQITAKSKCTVDTKHLLMQERGGSAPYSVSFSQPVDIVITWVNGSDPSLIEDMKKYNIPKNGNTSPNRFRDWGILRYCLRSVEKFANWIRHVYIVTNGQVPTWLNVDNPGVSIVKHSEIFPDKSHLPTFSSKAIECHIHRIPGLSQQFLYLNDDMFFANTVKPEDFFTNETGLKVRFGIEKIEDCSKNCKLSDLNNGICDTECNISKCDWDGEDCKINGSDGRPHTALTQYDAFFGSLLYSVILFNKEFGYVHRNVPAHVPYIIDKTLMDELQRRFPKEWEQTSASRVRDSYNLQYAFAYYHYLMRPQPKELGENRRIPIATTYQNYGDYTYFATGNPTSLDLSLKRLLQKRDKKFVCINDHMYYWNATAEAMCQSVIDSFFKQLVPERSSFELDGNE